jgi:hypothetical protein
VLSADNTMLSAEIIVSSVDNIVLLGDNMVLSVVNIVLLADNIVLSADKMVLHYMLPNIFFLLENFTHSPEPHKNDAAPQHCLFALITFA